MGPDNNSTTKIKDIISKITFTTFILGYLFFCGSVYLISFWSTFEFDITNYIDLLDIPKSFIYPLATGIGVSILGTVIQGIIHTNENLKKKEIEDQKLLQIKIKDIPTKTIFR